MAQFGGGPDHDHTRRVVSILVPAVLAFLTVVACGAAALGMYVNHDVLRSKSETEQLQPFLDAATQFAVDLASIDYRTVDGDLQTILDNSSGAFHDEFAAQSESLATMTRQQKTVSTGTVTGAGVESIDTIHTDVLVAVTVESSTNGDEHEPKHWRMRIRLAEPDYKAIAVEYVK